MAREKAANGEDGFAEFAAVVARNIKKFREQKRLTQLELSEMVGGSHSYVHHVEVRLRLPNLVMGLRLAKALGVPPEELLKR